MANTLSVVRILEAFRFAKLIYFSSGAVYDGLRGAVSPETPVAPALPYAVSKLASEHYLRYFQKHGRIDTLHIVRFFGAYGPFEPERKIYGRLVRRFAVERDPSFTIRGNGLNLIDAMYIDDAVRAILTLINAPNRGGTYDCASATPLTITSLVERAAATFGLRAEITYTGSVPEYIEFYSVDHTMRDRYGFAPQISLETGLRRFADFYKRCG
jgi:nucleoside-diphosphate-sugar epimerase